MLSKFKQIGRGAALKAQNSSKSRGTKRGQFLVALDIGTENVKALIGRVNRSGEVDIVGVGRQHQSLSDMKAGAISDIASVVNNCDQALHQAEQQAGTSVRSAIIGIAGELIKGTTTTVRVTRKNSARALDIPEMEKIIRLVQERAEAKAREQLKLELGGKDVEVRLVNSALVSIDIDGYAVTNPIGFQGRNVLVQLYTAFAPMIHIGALERTAQELDLDLLAVAAEPFAVARSVIGDKPNDSFSAVLMDVGGGTTDIAVINDGGVQGTKMFGIGGRAYTRSVMNELSVDFDEAEQLKLGLTGSHDPVGRQADVKSALAKTVDVWIKGVGLALDEFPMLDHLPNHIYLCGGGSSLELLMEKLSSEDWYKDLPFTRHPVVNHIHPDQVVGITDTTGNVNDHTFITAMGLLRVGLDTLQFGGDDSGASIREKMDKILRV